MRGILCFGDSITWGRGELPNVGWVGRLKESFERRDKFNVVYNLGICGNTSTDLLERFESEAKSRIIFSRPSSYLTLISIGTNDSKIENPSKVHKVDGNLYRSNIKKLISKAKSYKTALAFIGLPPVDETITYSYEDTVFTNVTIMQYNTIMREECELANVLFLDINTVMSQEHFQSMLADGLHPNSKGYEYMYTKIKELIEKNKLI